MFYYVSVLMLGTNGEGWGHMISQPGYFVGSLKMIHKNMKLIQSFHICCDFSPELIQLELLLVFSIITHNLKMIPWKLWRLKWPQVGQSRMEGQASAPRTWGRSVVLQLLRTSWFEWSERGAPFHDFNHWQQKSYSLLLSAVQISQLSRFFS